MQNLTKEERESVEFALNHLEGQSNNIIYFTKEVRTSEDVIKLMLSKHRVRQEYLNEIWDINDEAVVNFLSKRLQSVVSLRKEIRYDDRIISLFIKKEDLAKVLSMFKKEEWGSVFGKINLVIDILKSTGKGADEFVFNGHFRDFLSIALEEKPLEKIEKILSGYNKRISIQFVKLLLKNNEFKEIFEDIYKENLQKNDYRELIREALMIKKLNDLEEISTIERFQKNRNKI